MNFLDEIHLHNQGDPLINGYPVFVEEGMSWQNSQLIEMNPLINSDELMSVLIASPIDASAMSLSLERTPQSYPPQILDTPTLFIGPMAGPSHTHFPPTHESTSYKFNNILPKTHEAETKAEARVLYGDLNANSDATMEEFYEMSQSNGLHGQLLSAQSPGMADFIPPATDLDTGDTGESGGGIKAASMHYSPVVNADNTRQHAPSWGPETVPDQTPGAGPSSCDLNTAIDLLRGEVIVPNADNASGFSPVSPENSSKLASQSNTLKSNNVPSLPGQFTSVFICSVSGSQENSAVDPLLDLWATRATELKVSQTVLQIVIRRFLGEAYLPELQGFDYLISAERKKSLLIGCDLYPARDDGGPTRNLTDSEKALCFAALGVLSLSAESLGNIGYNAPLIQECFKYLNPAAEQYSNGQIRDRILPLAIVMLATAHFRLKAIHGDNEETLYATIVLLRLVRNTEYVEMDYQDVSDLENVLHLPLMINDATLILDMSLERKNRLMPKGDYTNLLRRHRRHLAKELKSIGTVNKGENKRSRILFLARLVQACIHHAYWDALDAQDPGAEAKFGDRMSRLYDLLRSSQCGVHLSPWLFI